MAITEISMVLWFIFFGVSVLFGVVMSRKTVSEGLMRSQREYYLGIAIFILVHLVARIFYFYYDFIEVGNEFYWELGAIVGMAGIIFLLYAIERHIYTRTKFFFTIVTILYIILIFILPPEIGTYLQTVIVAMVGIFIPLIYVYVAYKGSGEIRTNSLIIAVGILIFLVGQTAHGKTFFASGGPIYFIISPIFMSIGGLIFLYGLIRK